MHAPVRPRTPVMLDGMSEAMTVYAHHLVDVLCKSRSFSDEPHVHTFFFFSSLNQLTRIIQAASLSTCVGRLCVVPVHVSWEPIDRGFPF
jgi:hypothetical protein